LVFAIWTLMSGGRPSVRKLPAIASELSVDPIGIVAAAKVFGGRGQGRCDVF